MNSILRLQPEQKGRAHQHWLRIWQTEQRLQKQSEAESDPLVITSRGRKRPNGRIPPENIGNLEKNENNVNTDKIPNDKFYIGYTSPKVITPNTYDDNLKALHNEIESFYMYMRPTPLEQRVRSDLVIKIQDIVMSKWPNAKVEVFGSYRTGLYLPNSDIDLVVIGHWPTLPLHPLAYELVRQDVAETNKIKVLDKASVPIIKLTDKYNDIKVDISFNIGKGIKSVELVILYLQIFPCLPKLMYVLKQFLMDRDMNEVFTGGISSYSLILMCISFMQLHPRQEEIKSPDMNLAVLLLEFFELYGRKFNYFHTGIRVRNGGKYLDKASVKSLSSILWIEDPLQSSNNVGRSSYGVMEMKRAFDHAYMVLMKTLNPLSSDDNREYFSILGRIIKLSRIFERIEVIKQTTEALEFCGVSEEPIDDEEFPVAAFLRDQKCKIEEQKENNESKK